MSDNAIVEAWNTVLFDKFARHRDAVARALGPHGDRAIELLGAVPGDRVIDLGCGFGDTTRALARIVGPRGRVVGVDGAARYLEVARREAGGDEAIAYVVADLEEEVPGAEATYDRAYARFGTMFFARPVIALRTIRRALRPGGRLAMAVWRKKETNECLYVAEQAVRAILGDPAKGDQLTCGPGPFSMAGADLVTDQVLAAGFRDVALTRSDATGVLASDLEGAVDVALELGPAGEVVRLAGAVGVARRAEVTAAVRAALAPYATATGEVVGPTSAWVVTASA